ncbi:MAG: hypothetical protein ABI892_17720 [Flavobacterium sp.]
MGWIKELFEGLKSPDYEKMFRERLAREKKEKEDIFDFSENIDSINETIETHNVMSRDFEKNDKKQQFTDKDKKEEKALNDLKIVIDGAKLQCSLCTDPVGKLKL